MSRLRHKLRRPALAALVVVVLAGAFAGATFAAFSSKTDNLGDTVSAAPDYRAPTVSAQTVTKSTGGIGGYIAQNTQFYVYAQVVDTGNPASGIAPPVNAVANLPGYGLQTVPLVAGSYSVGGVSYNYRTAIQPMPPIAAQTIIGSVDTADNAGNSGSSSGNFVIDNTGGSSTTVQTANGGAIAGRPEAGDSITYTFSEPIEPMSILAGWTDPNSSQSVTVRINDGGAGNDTLLVYNSPGNTVQLPLGSVNLGRTDYVTANRTYTSSTMTASGNNVQIVLGTASGAGTTTAANGTMAWTPNTAVTDRAGNGMSGTVANESGAGDKEF
jgi:hypothetical protein